MTIFAIISCLDNFLPQAGQKDRGPVEGNAILAKAGIYQYFFTKRQTFLCDKAK